MEAQVQPGFEKPPVLTIENFISSLEARLNYEKQVCESSTQNVDILNKMIAGIKSVS